MLDGQQEEVRLSRWPPTSRRRPAVRRRRPRDAAAARSRRGRAGSPRTCSSRRYCVLFLGFVPLPAVYGIWISLHDYDFLLPRQPWVGLQQLHRPVHSRRSRDAQRVLAQHGGHRASSRSCSVPFLVVLPLGVAMLLNRRVPGPHVLPGGVLRAVRAGRGRRRRAVPVPARPQHRRRSTTTCTRSASRATSRGPPQLPWAWISLVAMTVWWTLGFNAIIYLAGLQDISPELYEAADGRRRHGVAAVPQRHHARAAAGAAVRAHHHDPGLVGQHVRSGVPRHPRARPAQRDPDGDHVHRPGCGLRRVPAWVRRRRWATSSCSSCCSSACINFRLFRQTGGVMTATASTRPHVGTVARQRGTPRPAAPADCARRCCSG